MLQSRAKSRIVNVAHCGHRFRSERRQARSLAIIGDLVGAFAAGDGAGDCVEHENPAQRELAQGDAGRQQRAEFLDRVQTGIVVHAGKSLAHVKCFAVPVEVTMIVRRESGIAAKFSGQQAAGGNN